MRATLTILSGTYAGRRIDVEPDSGSVLVGRSSDTRFAVPYDGRMSSRHFTLEIRDGYCRMTDLGSFNGTYVNGQKIAEANLKDGDQILAGQTTFSVKMQLPAVAIAPAPVTIPPPAAPTLPSVSPVPAGKTAGPSAATSSSVGDLGTVTLTILEGHHAGKSLTLGPGQKKTVGRTSRADLSLPDDVELSGWHFSLHYDVTGCHLKDMDSKNGCFVNGAKLKQAVLQSRDRIKAGHAIFEVIFEIDRDAPPPTFKAPLAKPTPGTMPDINLAPLPEPKPLTMQALELPAEVDEPVVLKAPREPWHDRLLQILRTTEQPLFALLDAARSPRILEMLRASKATYQSLYEGAKGEELAAWAPYLVRLGPQAPLLESLVLEGWGKSWGVYLTSAQPFAEVRKHFRQLLLVKLPDKREVYFRFYDPRVLRVYLPTCTGEEGTAFLGSLHTFFMEVAEPTIVWRFALQGGAMQRRSLYLTVTP